MCGIIGYIGEKEAQPILIAGLKNLEYRGYDSTGIASSGDRRIREKVDYTFYLPRTNEILSAIVAVVPLQLLAYYIALKRGCPVDQPRNLAKSVTVE